MTPQPDKLFHDKLDDFLLTTSSDAWSRVERGLESSSRRSLWIRISAAIFFLAAGSFLILHFRTSGRIHTMAIQRKATETEIEPKESNPIPPKEILSVQNLPLPIRNQKTIVDLRSKFEKHTDPTIDNNSIALKEENSAPDISQDTLSSLPSLEIKTEAEVAVDIEPKPIEIRQAVYIVYKAEDVNKKYLRSHLAPDTISPEKKLSTLDVLVGIAYNVKTGESGLGDLRQMKDEFFTLSFLDEKKNKN